MVVVSDTAKQRRRTILLVDDAPEIIEILEVNLVRANLRVVSAQNGAQALAKASNDRPDLILLDAVLPDIDGLVLCKHLKENAKTSHIPVVIIGEDVESEDVIAGIAAGAEDYIAKPLGRTEVVALVETHVRRAKQSKNANHLTKLPSRTYINDKITSLIRENKLFAVMYVDVDSTKVFSSAYGTAHGNRATRLLAETVHDAVQIFGNADDLVGQRDEDNLVVITTPEKAETLCRRIIADFDSRIKTLYGSKDLDRGYIECESQSGQLERSPIMTISIAVVTNKTRRIDTYLQANKIGAALRNHVKHLPGSNYLIDRRQNNMEGDRSKTPRGARFSYRQEPGATQRALSWNTSLATELEDPITSIRGYLDSILGGRVENLDSQQLSVLKSIEESTGQLLAVLRELEGLEGTAWDAIGALLDRADLKQILDRVVGLLQTLAEERGVEVYIQAYNGISQLMVDENSLIQGLFYLLKSQVESNTSGDRVLVSVLGEEDDFIAVEIINPNRYIPSRELAVLFRGQQESNTNTTRRNGLHLAIVLVQSIGGEIKVRSKRGEGTTFTVFIPKRWRSRVNRINRLQSEMEMSSQEARAHFDNIRHYLSSVGKQASSAVKENLEAIEFSVRELEVLCNLSLLLADDLSSDLERQAGRILEQEADRLLALEALLVMGREIARSAQAEYIFDLDSARRVARYALVIAAELNLPAHDRRSLHYAALLKDLGLALALDKVSNRTKGFTAERWEGLRVRLATVREALSRVKYLEPTLSLVSHKSERYDGTGYPSGLKGSEIPLGARILAVAEAFDTIFSGLSPLEVLGPEAAVRELAAESGRCFDPHVVTALLRAWRSGRVRTVERDASL